jgi:hypothetical protein
MDMGFGAWNVRSFYREDSLVRVSMKQFQYHKIKVVEMGCICCKHLRHEKEYKNVSHKA